MTHQEIVDSGPALEVGYYVGGYYGYIYPWTRHPAGVVTHGGANISTVRPASVKAFAKRHWPDAKWIGKMK